MKGLRMFYKALMVITLGLSCATLSCRSHSTGPDVTTTTPTTAEYLKQADQFYVRRDDLMQLREGIIALRQARTLEPGNYDVAWKLSKFDYYLGTHTDNNDERDKTFREGINAGKAAVQLQDGKPDGHFWLGANYGGSAQSSTLAGLATVSDIQTEMERVIKLDEGYQDGSAYMVLGMVYLQAPMLVGGDPQKAVDEMEKGLRFGPGNAFLRLHLAEADLKVGRKDQARQQLNAIVSMAPDQNYLPEYKEAVAQAHKLLDQNG
jgi:tetratricopeptide (TPR) repeat protein